MPSQFTEFPIPTEGITDTAAVTSLDSILGIKDGALKKETKENLLSDIGAVKFKQWTMTNNTTKVFQFTSMTKAVLFIHGNANNTLVMQIIDTTSTGSFNEYHISPGSSPMYTTLLESYKRTITNSTGYTARLSFLILYGDITEVTS